MKNTEFANENERKGFEYLTAFNAKLHLSNLTKTPKGCHFDASGLTTLNQPVEVENKIRNLQLLDDKTVSAQTWSGTTLYIENHQMADMLVDAQIYGIIPLYVNYLYNCIVVFNLENLKHRPKTILQKIWSKLYNRWEYEKRMELEVKYAYIYDRNNFNLIYKPDGK